MKVLIDICLIAALVGVVYITDGWWALLSLLPCIMFLARNSSDQPEKKRPLIFGVAVGIYRYNVTLQGGETTTVECKLPVLCEGAWAHFCDEVNQDNEFGCHIAKSFYMPQCISLVPVDVEKTLRSVE